MAEKNIRLLFVLYILILTFERREISDVLLMADGIPAGAEAFTAADASQFEAIKNY